HRGNTGAAYGHFVDGLFALLVDDLHGMSSQSDWEWRGGGDRPERGVHQEPAEAMVAKTSIGSGRCPTGLTTAVGASTRAPIGTSLFTSACAPMTAWSPIVTGPRTVALAPRTTFLPTTGWRRSPSGLWLSLHQP